MSQPDSDRRPLAAARSFLFVPGHRPELFAKAADSAAEVIILDLEDAVGPGDKDAARDHVRNRLAGGSRAVVRVNAPGTRWHDDDVAAVGRLAWALMVPKSERPADLRALSGCGSALIPLLETAAGIARAESLCAVPAVVRPAFGSIDLAAQLGVRPDSHEALRYARSAVVLAAAAAGVAPPIDGVTSTLDDPAVLGADIDHARLLGFTAKMCVHPRQAPLINAGFHPTPEEIAWARTVMAAAPADGSVTAIGGEMIDRPVLLRAEAILASVDIPVSRHRG
ncbi:HpcH/HpaI aldolase/citrate lyase family protein [Nocardia sp. NPDC057668]|uniref:HpcH/HpaI aldolase/citrate lyase family protein n=1 Tax=Nocardia sp. NPDC057668 TaxID=3346202 RepID=UPI00366DE4A3